MIYEWWLVGTLLIILIVLGYAYNRLKHQLQAQINETLRLKQKLAATHQELAEMNARRKKLLSASTQALIIVEDDFRISSANKVAKRLFGKFDQGTSLMAWVREHHLQELVEQILQGEKMPPIYFSWRDRNLEAHARAIKQAKQAVAVALSITDITELERLSRARRDFVTNISHELRTPLASLQLLTETLLNGAIDDKEMALKLLNKMADQTDTLSQLAREVLDLSMIEQGRAPMKMAPYSLQAMTQLTIEHLLPQAGRKNLTLQSKIKDDFMVLVDKTMIGRVLTNLMHNAIKFTDVGGVTVSAQVANKKVKGDWVKIAVSDTGKGIPPDELPRIFERFYKIDLARDRSGTGLGLAIAKHIVEAHGGHIWAESHYGHGTTFTFTLPFEEL